MCVNNLPKVVTWQWPSSESNLQPQGYKFGTLLLDYQATYYLIYDNIINHHHLFQ